MLRPAASHPWLEAGAWTIHGPLSALPPPSTSRTTFHGAVPVRALWEAFQAGERKWHTHLWGVLMFQAWRENLQRDPPSPERSR